MEFLKNFALTLLGLLGVAALGWGLLCLFSEGMSPTGEDADVHRDGIWSLGFAIFCGVLILMLLGGCSSLKPIVDACREGLCR
jgi:hypothetical protein